MRVITQSMLRAVFKPPASGAATQIFFYVAESDAALLTLSLTDRAGKPLGSMLLSRVGEEEGPGGVSLGLYELTQLLSADYPCSGQAVALSGVLWSRREVLAQIEAGDSSLPGEAAPRLAGARSGASESLRET